MNGGLEVWDGGGASLGVGATTARWDAATTPWTWGRQGVNGGLQVWSGAGAKCERCGDTMTWV